MRITVDPGALGGFVGIDAVRATGPMIQKEQCTSPLADKVCKLLLIKEKFNELLESLPEEAFDGCATY